MGRPVEPPNGLLSEDTGDVLLVGLRLGLLPSLGLD